MRTMMIGKGGMRTMMMGKGGMSTKRGWWRKQKGMRLTKRVKQTR
jgi:hypothetical protein